jgi:hypothetical protein
LIFRSTYFSQIQSWQHDPQILKAIATFYRKAKKLDSLANFFIECSQHAIDSSGDYERGMQVLGEAIKQLSSSKLDTAELQAQIRERAVKIKKFLDLKRDFELNTDEGIQMANDMLRKLVTSTDYIT